MAQNTIDTHELFNTDYVLEKETRTGETFLDKPVYMYMCRVPDRTVTETNIFLPGGTVPNKVDSIIRLGGTVKLYSDATNRALPFTVIINFANFWWRNMQVNFNRSNGLLEVEVLNSAGDFAFSDCYLWIKYTKA